MVSFFRQLVWNISKLLVGCLVMILKYKLIKDFIIDEYKIQCAYITKIAYRVYFQIEMQSFIKKTCNVFTFSI